MNPLASTYSDYSHNVFFQNHQDIVSNLAVFFEPEKVIRCNPIFAMDKNNFCFFIENNGYTVDKIDVINAKTIKVSNRQSTIIFQNIIENNKQVYCILMISYKEGDLWNIVFSRDGSVHEISYRSGESFYIKTKTCLSKNNWLFMIHNTLRSSCHLNWLIVNNGVITEAIYLLNNKTYHLNILLKTLGKDEIDLSSVKDYIKLTNLFTPEEVVIAEMALC